jgi:hypothetical protein
MEAEAHPLNGGDEYDRNIHAWYAGKNEAVISADDYDGDWSNVELTVEQMETVLDVVEASPEVFEVDIFGIEVSSSSSGTDFQVGTDGKSFYIDEDIIRDIIDEVEAYEPMGDFKAFVVDEFDDAPFFINYEFSHGDERLYSDYSVEFEVVKTNNFSQSVGVFLDRHTDIEIGYVGTHDGSTHIGLIDKRDD